MKKRMFLSALFAFFIVSGFSQENKSPTGYVFTDVKVNECTPVKNQNRSSTCWSFSGLSMIESDLIRRGKGIHDLSQMWVVRHAYADKAEKYVRMHGSNTMAPGGNFHDIFNVIGKYGIVPAEVYTGNRYGTDLPVHNEVDALLKAYADVIVRDPNKTLTPVWQEGFNSILDTYLGAVPRTFTYRGKQYTPQSFAAQLGIDPNDYVTFTSYTHHPFYMQFALEIPDNWAWGLSYNIPMEEMIEIIDHAIENGYTVAWGSDVSERGFSHKQGLALLPETDIENMGGSDKVKWENLSGKALEEEIYKLNFPVSEKKITQELRQQMFDNYQTTDDHGMEIIGIARDQKGNKFYKVKNSWGTDQLFGGYFYASEAFVLAKTTHISLHKGGVPPAIAKKARVN